MNKLYFGDNLKVMRDFGGEIIDLIYLDPPFQSGKNYNQIFQKMEPKKGESVYSQITTFSDTWEWNAEAVYEYEALLNGELTVESPTEALKTFMRSMYSCLGNCAIMAYLVKMAPRLCEMRRVLKATGSIYLHCDSSCVHYLKMLMDTIFGVGNFKNEIVWKRTSAHNDPKKYGRNDDRLLFYSKTDKMYFKPRYTPYEQSYIDNFYKFKDERGCYRLSDLTGAGITKTGDSGMPWRGYDPSARGRHWALPEAALHAIVGEKRAHKMSVKEKLELLLEHGRIDISANGVPSYKRYLDEMPGVTLQTIWTDINNIASQSTERLGYPTQKPEALLERILGCSLPPDGIVCDPYCGCGTTIAVAQRLGYNWVGIDITHLAIQTITGRLERHGIRKGTDYQLAGIPVDLNTAKLLAAENKKQFEIWAVDTLGGVPNEKSRKGGADGGVDGTMEVYTTAGVRVLGLINIKGGGVTVDQVKAFCHDVEQRFGFGILLAFADKITVGMKRECAKMGKIQSRDGDVMDKAQIFTVEDFMAGKRPLLPGTSVRARKRGKSLQKDVEQISLDSI